MTSQKIADKIRKLLTQAADREGTPEGDIFQAKALDLLARYGLTEFDIEDNQKDLQEQVIEHYEVTKHFRVQRQTLLGVIARALGVFAVRRTGSTVITLAGTRRNVTRAVLLFEQLSIHVASGALRESAYDAGSTARLRRGYWEGYSEQIYLRLVEMEREVHDELRKTGAALVPVNEYEKAQAMYREQVGGWRSATPSYHDAESMNRGRNRAKQADLGQARVQNRLELV